MVELALRLDHRDGAQAALATEAVGHHVDARVPERGEQRAVARDLDHAAAVVAHDDAERLGREAPRGGERLEPQAVSDLCSPILNRAMNRVMAEQGMGPFAAGNGNSKIGQKVFDERITISADPMDPDCGFVPFDWNGEPYQAVNWFERGVLKELAYDRHYGLTQLNRDAALPNSRAYRMSGGTATIDEMIASTERGILVTRFNAIGVIDINSMLLGGNTRDGLWLVERGKISRPIKNFRITESPLFALNNIAQLGIPQRVFRPAAPAVVPALKINDFSFTGMMDAV